jgi:hypothetical protein
MKTKLTNNPSSAHVGVPGNEAADGNTKCAAGEVDVHPRARSCIQCQQGIEFLICTAGFMGFNLWFLAFM